MSEGKDLAGYLEQQRSKLVDYEGPVIITIAKNGKFSVGNATLRKVDPKSQHIQIENGDPSISSLGDGSIPLLGRGMALKRVTDRCGNVIYENTEVVETYCLDASDDVRRRCGLDSTQ